MSWPIRDQSGFILIWWALALPMVTVVIASIMILVIALNLRIRLEYRCRDEALKAQEKLISHLDEMSKLNRQIELAHTTYKLLLAGQVIPPTALYAQMGFTALKVIKKTLDVQQDALHLKMRTFVLTRASSAEVSLTSSLKKDFNPDRPSFVEVFPSRPRLRLFRVHRLDEISKLLEPIDTIEDQTKIHWRWSFSPHHMLPEHVIAFLRRTMSLKPIMERRRADGGLHAVNGACQSHIQKVSTSIRGVTQWAAYLGLPALSSVQVADKQSLRPQ